MRGCKSAGRTPNSWLLHLTPPTTCHWRYVTRKYRLSISSHIWIPDHEWWLFISWHYISYCEGSHVSPIKSTFSQTPLQHKNQNQHGSRPGCLCFALWLWSPHQSPPLRCVRHALPKAPPVCVLAAEHQQPKHPWTHQASNRIISPTTTPPTLVSDISYACHPHSLYEGSMLSTQTFVFLMSSAPRTAYYQHSWLEKTKRSAQTKRDEMIPLSTSIMLASTPPEETPLEIDLSFNRSKW